MFNTNNFLKSLVMTNKSHEFFSDWEKARLNQHAYKDELALLSVLSHSSEPKEELSRLIASYPRINSLIPLLNAIRVNKSDKSLMVLNENSKQDIQYFFHEGPLSEDDILKTVSFADKSGLLNELVNIKSHSDYYFGVEVGMDTNARKNRSGTAMENLVESQVKTYVEQHNGVYRTQLNFEKAGKLFGVSIPDNWSNKRGDFMLFVNNKPINIETNFFDGNGSKQEIMNSYVGRAQDLKDAGWGFGLITDGLGWSKANKQLDYGYSTIKYIMSLSMCSKGALDEMLEDIAQ